jgi:hypothetical protein
MLLAKDVVAVEADFINVLAHIPGTKEQIQSYFSSRGQITKRCGRLLPDE